RGRGDLHRRGGTPQPFHGPRARNPELLPHGRAAVPGGADAARLGGGGRGHALGRGRQAGPDAAPGVPVRGEGLPGVPRDGRVVEDRREACGGQAPPHAREEVTRARPPAARRAPADPRPGRPGRVAVRPVRHPVPRPRGMGQAGPAIQADLGLTNRQLGYALMAFTVAYALFEVPTGRLGDRIGPRAVLTRVVVWRSAFTALTGACAGLVSLVVVRFLFGAGEAGAYPNTARVLSRWFPAAERGRVTGLMLTCAQLGGAAALALTAALIWLVGWRWAFVAFGLVGFAWA